MMAQAQIERKKQAQHLQQSVPRGSCVMVDTSNNIGDVDDVAKVVKALRAMKKKSASKKEMRKQIVKIKKAIKWLQQEMEQLQHEMGKK